MKIPLQWRYPSLTTGESPTRFRRSVERVAQSVEHLTFNQVVAGSIPAPLTNLFNEMSVETSFRWLDHFVFWRSIGAIAILNFRLGCCPGVSMASGWSATHDQESRC